MLSLHMRLVDATRGIVTARRPRPDEADRAARQHQPGRADRTRRARRGAAAPGGRAWPPSTSTRTSRCVDPTDPLLQLDNVVCTPHIGYVTRDEWELQFADIFDQINAFAAGAPTNVVNPGCAGSRSTGVLSPSTRCTRVRTTGEHEAVGLDGCTQRSEGLLSGPQLGRGVRAPCRARQLGRGARRHLRRVSRVRPGDRGSRPSRRSPVGTPRRASRRGEGAPESAVADGSDRGLVAS